MGCKTDGSEVNLRTSKWNSLHLIFIFVSEGRKNEAHNLCKLYCNMGGTDVACLLYTVVYIRDGLYLRRILRGRRGLHNLVIRRTFTNLYL